MHGMKVAFSQLSSSERENWMPTLSELQNERPGRFTLQDLTQFSEEVIEDSRANLRPSQLVERKLESRTLSDTSTSRSSIYRPRAK
jgi:hypothetical protein